MKKIIFAAVFLCILILSCKKAGNDGDATVVAFLHHHSAMVVTNRAAYLDTVYVKFNSSEAASSLADYDTYYVGEAGEDHVHCTNLHTGKYYFFAVGEDSMLHQRVTGGIAVQIKHKDRSAEIDQVIQVSE